MADEKQVQEDIDEQQMEALNRHAERNRAEDDRSQIIEAVPNVLLRGSLYSLMGIILLFVVITIVTKVHVKVPATGKIVPQGQNITLEARSPGTVIKVHSFAGDQVKKGQPILTLQKSESEIDLATMRRQFELEQTKRDQLAAALDLSKNLIGNPQLAVERDPSTFVDAGPALVHVNALRNALKAQKKAGEDLKDFEEREHALGLSQIKLNEDTLNRHERNLGVARRTLKSLLGALARKREELKKVETLAEKRIVALSAVNAAKDSVIQGESEVNAQRQRISQTELSISSTKLKVFNLQRDLKKREKALREVVEKSRTDVDKALAVLGNAITTFSNDLIASEGKVADLGGKVGLQEIQVKELNIISPVDGVLTSLKFETPGRLVERGASVATIVPKAPRPIVLAHIQNKDVAFVHEGIPARIKVDAYPHRQFGTVPAKIVRVYPLPDKPAFAVRLELERSTIKVRGKDVLLKPGLAVQADLLTEKRRLIELILKKMN